MLRQEAGEQLSEKSSDLLVRIDTSARRMHNLVSALLELAQLDAAPLTMRSVALSTIVGEVLAEFSNDIEASGAVVDVAALPSVTGDAGLLRQLFQNLISNALKFHRPDVAPRVQVRCNENTDDNGAGGQCRVSVSDKGIGFPSARAELIFQPFRRLVGSSFEGSGIGMATAKKIVQLHGGKIWAEGQPDEGATFTVTLPPAENLSDLQLARL